MSDIETAALLLKNQNYTCVLCKGDTVHTSTLRGVAPIIGLLDSGTDLRLFSVADKVVGKAAALLFALAGIKEVYAEVISEPAAAILSRYSIRVQYGVKVGKILNRAGTDSCPLERSVESTDDPQTAFELIRLFVNRQKS